MEFYLDEFLLMINVEGGRVEIEVLIAADEMILVGQQ